MLLGQATPWVALTGIAIDSMTRAALVAVALWSRDADRRATARTILGIGRASPVADSGTGAPHQPKAHYCAQPGRHDDPAAGTCSSLICSSVTPRSGCPVSLLSRGGLLGSGTDSPADIVEGVN
jgi:hypothetical protein